MFGVGRLKVPWCKGLIGAVVLGCFLVYFIKLQRGVPASCSSAIQQKEWTRTAEIVETSEFQNRVIYYKSKIWQPGPLDNEPPVQCTMLMATYKREKLLPRVLSHYCSKNSIINRIVVVWNDPDTPVPQSLHHQNCSKQLRVVTTTQNKMTNRFLLQNLDTNDTNNCIFIVDDDIITSWRDLRFGFDIWKRYRHHIVGFDGRTRLYSILKDGSYYYGVTNQTGMIFRPNDGGYAFTLPGFFFHRAYLEMLFDPKMVAPELLSYVDEVMNCDDILFSMMVARFVRHANLGWSAGLAVQPEETVVGLAGGFYGLSSRPDHPNARSKCLNKFVPYLGSDSLTLSKMIVNSSLETDATSVGLYLACMTETVNFPCKSLTKTGTCTGLNVKKMSTNKLLSSPPASIHPRFIANY